MQIFKGFFKVCPYASFNGLLLKYGASALREARITEVNAATWYPEERSKTQLKGMKGPGD